LSITDKRPLLIGNSQDLPVYSIIASVVPGTEIGEVGDMGERFIDDKRIDGTLSQMLEDAVTFVTRNMKRKLIVDDQGRRADIAEYPIKAIREAFIFSFCTASNCPCSIIGG